MKHTTIRDPHEAMPSEKKISKKRIGAAAVRELCGDLDMTLWRGRRATKSNFPRPIIARRRYCVKRKLSSGWTGSLKLPPRKRPQPGRIGRGFRRQAIRNRYYRTPMVPATKAADKHE